jgi:adenylate cyclase
MSKNFIEIERKFLVKPEFVTYRHLILEDCPSRQIKQAYLVKNSLGSIRIRIESPVHGEPIAYLMSKTKINDMSNIETNDIIDHSNALQLIKNFSLSLIEKTRYDVSYMSKKWEIDFFLKPSNLILAEVELESEDETLQIPDWIGEEVTGDPRYYNANM